MNVKTARPLLLLSAAAVAILLSVRGVVIGRSSGSTPSPSGTNALLTQLNERYPEPPPGQNAATEFIRGFEALQISKLTDTKLPPVGAPTPVPLKLIYTSIVLSNREALRFLAEGAKYQQCRYPIDLTAGIDLLLPHLPKLKNSARLLQITAIVHADARQAKQAANDVLTGLALARSLDNEPPLLSQLTRGGSIALAVGALEQILSRVALPADSLDELHKQLTQMEAHQAGGKSFDTALLMEEASSVALFSAPSRLVEILSGPGVKMPEAERAGYAARVRDAAGLKQDRACYEEVVERLMRIREQPFPARLQADAFVEQRANEATQTLPVASFFLRGLKKWAPHEAEGLAWLRLGKTALALERFRALHANHYPSMLSELEPAQIASDPFNGRSLQYVSKNDGYLLYSVGPDLKDDSGQRLDGHKGDLVFTVTRRP